MYTKGIGTKNARFEVERLRNEEIRKINKISDIVEREAKSEVEKIEEVCVDHRRGLHPAVDGLRLHKKSMRKEQKICH